MNGHGTDETRWKRPTGSSRRTRKETLASLLTDAGLDSRVASIEALNRDEDGTHSRVWLEDGTTYVLREYATTSRRADLFRMKEAALYGSLRAAGLPVPRVLSSIVGSARAGGDAPAILLTDTGGTLLEQLFRVVPGAQRRTLWASVGAELRQLHDIDIAFAGPLSAPERQRSASWFVAELSKVLQRLKKAQPATGDAVDALLRLRTRLRKYLDARPLSFRHGQGWYLPEMLMEPTNKDWRCVAWLGWGYYASVGDPVLDIVGTALIHREWTGDEMPASFYNAYGERPDPVCALVYEAYLQLWRAPVYARGSSRMPASAETAGRQRALATLRPPHSTALLAMKELRATADQLATLLG